MIAEATRKLMQQVHLSAEESQQVMDAIMSGTASSTLVAAYLTALRLKGETAAEILGAARTMRRKVTRIRHHQPVVIDNCGTGGDGAGTFNISTTVSFVLAGGGLAVAKHGNRSVSSRCGSADLLQALGANLDLSPDQVARCIDDVGLGFMFAPLLHPAMKAVMPIRRELGFRTVFNMLGPLTNPAFATHQVIGVFDPMYLETIAEVAHALGVRNVFVVHNAKGIDELATCGVNRVATIDNGRPRTFELDPAEFGFSPSSVDELSGGDAAENAGITLAILNGERSPKYDTVVLNAAMGLLAGEKVESIEQGIKTADEIIQSGQALEKLNGFVEYTHEVQNAA